jgi:uncharacterized protein YuzE
MTLSYDKDADVLYITFERLPGQKYIYVENVNGDVLRLDKESRRVVGITIPFFAKRAAEKPLSIPEIGPVPFNERSEDLVSI